MQRPYIIYAPKYIKSNGARVLYKLADLLRLKGYEAYMYACPSDEFPKCNYISHKDINDELRKNAIIIYPEIIFGNPLQFQNVVRWVLYFPGVNGGAKKYHKSEIVYTFLEEYYPGADNLFTSTLDRSLFYKDDTLKTVDCYFVYKGGKWKDVPEFKQMIEINASYPKTRLELANLLRKTKTLYSYDKYSILLDEAVCCGCNVKIITKDGFEDYTGYENLLKLDRMTESQLEHFINTTQKRNYTGEIEQLSIKYRYWIVMETIKYFLYKYVLRNKKIAERYFYRCKKYMA